MPHITPAFFTLLADSRAFPKAGEQARPDAQLITPEFFVLFGLVVLVIGIVAAVKKYNAWRERRDRCESHRAGQPAAGEFRRIEEETAGGPD